MENYAAFLQHHHHHRSSPPSSSSSSHRLSFLPSNVRDGGGGGGNDCGPSFHADAAAAAADGGAGEACRMEPSADLVGEQQQQQEEEEEEEEAIAKTKEKKARKHRYAFQTRSQVDILDDGYRWRKYGQKAVKNNSFPRSYYRCTHQGCNVKKQVQRLAKDEGIVVTTYEGVHTHAIERPSDNFEHILKQMQVHYSHF